jgi:ribosome-associated protein
MSTFHLDNHPHIALCDLLKIEGWCDSGGAAKQAIDDGLVTVNGKVELRRRCKITASQVVCFAGQTLTIMA